MAQFQKQVIGPCTLYLGDCLTILPQIDEAFSGVLTDPPYGIDYKSGYATDDLWVAGRKIENDDDTLVRDEAISLCRKHSSPPMLVFGSRKRGEPSGTKMVLTWDKGPALGMGDLSLPWKPSTEEIYVLGSGFAGKRDKGSVIYHAPVQSMAKNGRQHPNQKPVGLLKILLQSLPRGIICDPFMGSGSTGVACVQAGYGFIGIESKPEFFEIACERITAAHKQPDMFIDQWEAA
ncbi:DNA-methyltransferase [Rhizobium sp.]|uniref:DNA-methyltransferase n=1 Tax=Rhizobium sp. TaxID=391 RepID=UPI003F814CC2